MTVKELREAIANLPDDGEVYIQKIEDIYFEKHGWSTLKVCGEHYHNAVQRNMNIDSGRYLDKEQYPSIRPELLVKYSEHDLEQMKEQYIDTHCCINYDGKNLYITSHY